MASGPVYEAGTRYWGKVIGQSFGKSQDKGTPQLALTFQIMGKVNPLEPEGDLLHCPVGNRTVFWYFTEKTMSFVIEDMQRLGFNKTSLKFLDPNVEGYFDFNGVEMELYCKHESYKNTIKERWGLSKPRAEIEADPLESNEVRKLDALFGKSLRQLAGKAAQTPVENPSAVCADEPTKSLDAANDALAQEAAALQGVDDIPF